MDTLSAELRETPNDTGLRFKLAEAHAGHDEWRACLMQIKLIERLAPGRYPTGYLRGLSLHVGGRDEEARRALDGFLGGNPNHGDGLATRGRVLLNLGLPSEAAADFQKAMNLATSPNPDLVVDLAKAYKDSGRPEEASRVIDEGLKTVGDTPSLLLCALEIESGRGAWEAALGRIDALQKTAPSPEPWMAERALVLSKAGRSAESRAAWIALRNQLLSLPNLERGYPQNAELLNRAQHALGESAPQPVAAPPASF
ncbi:MAG: tetratricopeptide repeat protein [Luteolibacter sp.]|uniref:tetratricopeptide repeat protein n=1 Tax=Luteolibacter sp. TaxID=1962973 RepID=UPI0032666FA1